MILLTGGAGYIGSHVNKLLTNNHYETLIFDNLIYGHREFAKWGEFILGDLENTQQLELLFQKYKINAVMHFAAFAYVGESVVYPQKYYLNNLRNTLNLLQVMMKYDVKYFVFSSTCAVYGTPNLIPIPENHSLQPINPYGKSKLMLETILQDYSTAYGLKYVSLRYFNAAGADPDCEIGEWHCPETHLIPLVLDAAMQRRSNIEIFGTNYSTPDGTCIRDFIHVVDIAKAHILALKYLMNGGRSDAFNLGNGNGYSVKEVIETARKITKKNIKIKPCEKRPGDPPILVGSAKKANEVLGWKPEFCELEPILETAWAWHQKLWLQNKLRLTKC